MKANELADFLEAHKVVGGLVVGDVTMDSIIETIRDLQKKLDESQIEAEWNYTKFMEKCTELDALQDNIHWIGLDLIKRSGWIKNYQKNG